MRSKLKFLGVLILLLGVNSFCLAQIPIEREILFKIPAEISYNLLGMRANAGKVFLMNSLGRTVLLNLETRESFSGRLRGVRPIDFDLVLGQPIYLTEEGTLGGQIDSAWPRQAHSACRIEVCDQGILLTGGEKMIFLAQNATNTVEVPGLNFAVPLEQGFVWSLGTAAKGGPWMVSLFDCFGNLMKEIYRFSPGFSPIGIEAGPKGFEGELLLSAYENNQRKLILIGQNGYMLWKIDGPEKQCPRDIAFDDEGNLLVIEKSDGGLVISRWKFAAPQG